MLLDGVEGGLTELQGDAFIYKDVDQRTLRVRIPSVPVLYINRHSADFTRHSVCDTTKNKDKAMWRVLARLGAPAADPYGGGISSGGSPLRRILYPRGQRLSRDV